MTCCDAQGHMKRNNHGTQFFAHNRTGGCNYQPESIEHLFLKDKILRICKENEYEFVDVEKHGDDWIADVYIKHKNRKYAFEVQLSSITFEVLKDRSAKYIRDGIHPVWILKEKYTERFDHYTYSSIKSSEHETYFNEHKIVVSNINNFDTILYNIIKIDTFDGKIVDLANFVDEIVSGDYIKRCFTDLEVTFHDRFMTHNSDGGLGKFFNIK